MVQTRADDLRVYVELMTQAASGDLNAANRLIDEGWLPTLSIGRVIAYARKCGY